MVIHLGANPKYGTIAVYNTVTKEIHNCEITRTPDANEDKVENLFNYVKENFKETFGICCVLLDGYVENGRRQRYIEVAKACGFENAEIISVAKAELIDMIKNIPVHEERKKNLFKDIFKNEYYYVFHSTEYHVTCFVWQRTKNFGFSIQHAEMIHVSHDYTQNVTLQDIKNFKKNLKINANKSKIGFFDYNQHFRRSDIFQVFHDTKNFYFCQEKPWTSSPILYACYLSGDPKFLKYKSNEKLAIEFVLKCNNITVITTTEFAPLPFAAQKLINTRQFVHNNKARFHIYDESSKLLESYYIDVPPPRVKIKFEIDVNGIYCIKAFCNKKEIEIIKENVEHSFYRIPGRAFYYITSLKAIGIDFGTSRCCAAVNRHNRIETVVLDNNGSRMLPTYVSFDEKQEKCGKLVIDRMKDKSVYTVFDIKRIMGKSYSEIVVDPMWSFKLKNSFNTTEIVVETCEGIKTFSPEEIVAVFLKDIKNKVEIFQNTQLSEVVITFPALYDETQKQALLKAAKFAGWKIIYLIPEPIAAAFAYCDEADLEINLNILIFDLGGGTLDISVVRTSQSLLHVLSFNGSLSLGGRDFDSVLINYFDTALINNHAIEVMENESKKYRFMSDCQGIKCVLSYETESWLEVENYDNTSEEIVQITREKFEQLSRHLLERIERITKESVNKANIVNDQIDVVLYVGGGCKMPMIKNLLSNMFPSAEHCCNANPDEMVAKGAALYGCLLKCQYP